MDDELRARIEALERRAAELLDGEARGWSPRLGAPKVPSIGRLPSPSLVCRCGKPWWGVIPPICPVHGPAPVYRSYWH